MALTCMVHSIKFENPVQLTEKHKDIKRTGKTLVKNGKTNTVIDITHLENLKILVPQSELSMPNRPKPYAERQTTWSVQ